MIAQTLRHSGRWLALLPLALTAAAPAAPGTSPWNGDARAAVRLVDGTRPDASAFLDAGVEVRLGAGWKTYWRYPGDAGIPPRFDFSGSSNVKSAVVSWPAPRRFDDGGGTSIGYSERVTFPVRIERQDQTRPAELRVQMDYAICERLCVPASATATLTLPSGNAETTAIARAKTLVPRPAKLGEGSGLAIRALRREGNWPHPRVVVEVAAPPGAAIDLFAEGPTAEWSLPLPEPAGESPDGTRRFAFTLDGAPPGAADLREADLTLTAIAGEDAIEVRAHLD